jgi:putative transposase
MLEPFQLYHIYNQGNNKQRIFFDESNYLFFLRKVQVCISPHASLLAYCLMPNHFHFLIYTNEASCLIKQVGSLKLQALSNGFRILESTYARAINKKFNWSGSLFRQRTKRKNIPDTINALHCMRYIHQNPLKAGLVEKIEQWNYSSFPDYCGFRRDAICECELAKELLAIKSNTFYQDSYVDVSRGLIRECF